MTILACFELTPSQDGRAVGLFVGMVKAIVSFKLILNSLILLSLNFHAHWGSL